MSASTQAAADVFTKSEITEKLICLPETEKNIQKSADE